MLLTVLVLLGLFFILVMMGVPIAVSIALASVSTLMLSMSFDPAMTTMAQRLAGGLDSFTLLAIPFFVISGYLRLSRRGNLRHWYLYDTDHGERRL